MGQFFNTSFINLFSFLRICVMLEKVFFVFLRCLNIRNLIFQKFCKKYYLRLFWYTVDLCFSYFIVSSHHRGKHKHAQHTHNTHTHTYTHKQMYNVHGVVYDPYPKSFKS